MIYRTFFCLNKNCSMEEFTLVDVEDPPCPVCQGRTQWIPRTTGVISANTQKADNTVRELRETYGDRNYASPVRGERVMPRMQETVVPGRTMKFAPKTNPGWAIDMPLTPDGKLTGAAACAPTGISVRGTHPVGQGRARVPIDGRSVTQTGAIPQYEASHRPPGGVR